MTSPTHIFLAQLFGQKPAAAAVQLWAKTTKKTHTFDVLPNAADWAAQQAERGDIYVAAGLAGKVVQPVARRAATSEVIGIPGVWADIDVNGGPGMKTNAAPTMEAAIELACQLIDPTLLVMSGHGLQAWWLLDEPWLFGYEAERERAAQIVQGFQGALRAAARERDANWTIDSTFDLARLMRLPGTLNHKGQPPALVEQLDHEGPNHDLDALASIAHSFIDTTNANVRAMQGLDVEIHVNGNAPAPPLADLTELGDIDPEFRAIWDRISSPKRSTWSHSEYDMSIANYLVRAGFSDQDIAESLRYHRARFKDQSGKGDRVDYLQRTIAKARQVHGKQERERRREASRDEAREHLDEIAEAAATGEGSAPSVVTTSLFTRYIGGPEVKELVQEGTDPDLARFKLVLADGREVRLGPVTGLLDQTKFRAAFATVTQHVVADIKRAEWHKAVQALLTAAQVNDEAENTFVAQVMGWLDGYLERRVSHDHDAACQAQDPFMHNDQIHVPAGPFKLWVTKVRGERITEVDLKLLLKAAGFERKTIGYRRDDGSKSSRSYYVAPKEVIEHAE